MTIRLRSLFIMFMALFAPTVHAQSSSPYTAETDRAIKALSPEETRDYLEGRGMGLARAAELNGYPGPMHVLELATPLALTNEQLAKTRALFESMRAQAIEAGRALVDEERKLDHLFRSKSVDRKTLAEQIERIGARQAAVRRVHLAAHLDQVAILTPAQIAQYNELRGYAGGAREHGHPGRHRH